MEVQTYTDYIEVHRVCVELLGYSQEDLQRKFSKEELKNKIEFLEKVSGEGLYEKGKGTFTKDYEEVYNNLTGALLNFKSEFAPKRLRKFG